MKPVAVLIVAWLLVLAGLGSSADPVGRTPGCAYWYEGPELIARCPAE